MSVRPLLSLPGVGDFTPGTALWEAAFPRPAPSASPRETKPQNNHHIVEKDAC